MKKDVLIICLLLISSLNSFAQTQGELERKIGFKGIVLGSYITKHTELEYKKEHKDKNIPEAKIYHRKQHSYTDIGGIKILDLEVKVYRGTIYEIDIITEKDNKLAKSLKKAFGTPNYSVRSGTYNWGSPSVSLSMIGKGKSKIELIYRWSGIKGLVKKDHQVEIDEISGDF